MKNILESSKSGKPTAALKYAADRLLSAAMEAGELSDGDIIVFKTSKKEATQEKINLTINHMGANKGPAQNARKEFETYYVIAVDDRYNFDDDNVCEQFGHFLLALVTAGFEGVNNTGTQMGEFRGEWRGGGFGSTS